MRQIVSASSHPASLSLTLHFFTDSRINVSVILGEADMKLIAYAIKQAQDNFKSWIAENFECLTEREWQCRQCGAVLAPIEREGGERIMGVVDVMEVHRGLHKEDSHG